MFVTVQYQYRHDDMEFMISLLAKRSTNYSSCMRSIELGARRQSIIRSQYIVVEMGTAFWYTLCIW